MSATSTIAATKSPLSASALAWKAILILIPLLTAAGLFLLWRIEVTRLRTHVLPSYGMVPPFTLVDQNARSFSSQKLARQNLAR